MNTKDRNYSVFTDFSSEYPIPEKVMRKKPTKLDLKYVRRILNGFGIDKDVKIPDCNSVNELSNWLRDAIMKHLNR